MKKVRLTLSIADTHLADIGTVAKAVKKAGMTVEQQHAGIGVLTGSIDADKLGALNRVAGVASVEEERAVGVAPPRSPIQ